MDDRQDATDTTGEIKTRLNPKSPREALAPEQAPPLPRSRRARNPIVVIMNGLVTLLLLGVLAAGALLYWGKREFEKPGPLTQEKIVVVPADSGLVRIADILESEEHHVDELEKQFEMIERMGMENYVQLQSKPASDD